MSIYDYNVPKPNGEKLNLVDLKGKVLLIVNTATGCGFTPQYEAIETLYEKYHDNGLEIIDIPCNQFGHQTPGTDAEVHEFCQLHYNTKFPQMKKSDVNGANELPLYTFLKSEKGFAGFGEHKLAALLADMLGKADPDWDKKPDIKWNFTKFLINRDGVVIERFEPTADMKEVEAKIIKLL
ncbi:MAG: glutathione peroxidase [Alphaproteobacteria bacterium]|nr:glutathione peroxidase [Alphaproteobacteria bacterium]